MIVDLTTKVQADSEIIVAVKKEKNAHVIMGHIGTHLDTYEKTNIPIEYFKSEAILFDVSNLATIDIKDVDLKKVQENDFVIFKTNHISKFTYGTKDYFNDHPQLTDDLINELLKCKIRFIGIDCPGIRQGKEHEVADRLSEKHGTYVIENLDNLSSITKERFEIYTMWLEDSEMTGLRCRVIAQI